MVERRCKLPNGLPFFEPSERFAVLLNNYDLYDQHGPDKVWWRGNRRIHDIEALLKGSFEHISEPHERRSLEGFREHEMGLHVKNRLHLPYRSTDRIMPPSGMIERLDSCLGSIAKESAESSLSFVYITSHGEQGHFAINNTEEYAYDRLFEKLGEIRGKKVVTVFACYSGSLVSAFEKVANPEDYIVLASTAEDEKGVNWGEDELHTLLVDKIWQPQKLSTLVLPERLDTGKDYHRPSIYGGFDVIL